MKIKRKNIDKVKQGEPVRGKFSKSAASREAHSPELSAKSVVEVEISGLDDEGYGISCSETHALRIGGALPGDTVRAGIDHVARRMAFGHVKKILAPSLQRSRRPPCARVAASSSP